MTAKEPITELEPQFSSESATPTPWTAGREHLEKAELYWLATVRPEGRPHVTPMIAIWLEEALYFCTGENERKAKNLANNTHCILMTGCNTFNEEGLDLVVEGEAVRVSDEARLLRIAAAYEAKYGSDWRFTVHDGAFHGIEGNIALVYEVRPTMAFGFGKGKSFSQTRWRF